MAQRHRRIFRKQQDFEDAYRTVVNFYLALTDLTDTQIENVWITVAVFQRIRLTDRESILAEVYSLSDEVERRIGDVSSVTRALALLQSDAPAELRGSVRVFVNGIDDTVDALWQTDTDLKLAIQFMEERFDVVEGDLSMDEMDKARYRTIIRKGAYLTEEETRALVSEADASLNKISDWASQFARDARRLSRSER